MKNPLHILLSKVVTAYQEVYGLCYCCARM